MNELDILDMAAKVIEENIAVLEELEKLDKIDRLAAGECRWKLGEGTRFKNRFSGWETDCGHITVQHLDYKYCPYCGRRIKFEE